MPGKTKHFQTLNLEFGERNICLVDCPGLVFPSFANSKAEMYCCGVLPIHTIREYITPVSLIMSRVPKEVLEAFYKINLPPRAHPKYTAMTLLSMISLKKGWITGSSNPNTAQASRQVLIDYTTGNLVFCHLRPDYSREKHSYIIQSGFNLLTIEQQPLDPVTNAIVQAEINSQADTGASVQQSATSQNVNQASTSQQPVPMMRGIPKSQEEELDEEFFQGNSTTLKKLKLNKGEKRALKFMIQKETGQLINIDEFLKSQDINELRGMLATEAKNNSAKNKKGIETGFAKPKKGGTNNSNKMYDFAEIEK